jgi:hypothetical protein
MGTFALGSGIFQRVGPDPGDVTLLYKFVEPKPLPRILDFVKTVRGVADRWLERNFRDSMKKALARSGK